MKRWLLIGTTALALTQAAPAKAQGIPVIDTAAIAKLFAQLEQMKQDYTMYQGIFASLVRAVDPNNLAQNLTGMNPLPGASQISSMLSGSGNFGNLSGLAGQFLKANTVYSPQSTGPNDFNAGFLQRSGNSLSGVQAMAQSAMQGIETHIGGITQIQRSLSSVSSAADLAAVQGRLQAEQANLAAEGVQAQSLGNLLAAQRQQYDLQQLQVQRQSADALLASVTTGGASGPPTPTLTAVNLPTFTAGP